MATLKFKTDLSCGKCVEKLKTAFNDEGGITAWDVDLKSPDKILTVHGNIHESGVTRLVEKAGYHVLGGVERIEGKAVENGPGLLKTYHPLILIFCYITGFILLKQISSHRFDSHEAMLDFMGGFFIVFSFFKMLNLKGFAEAYATYDVLAKRSHAYGYVYPFLELALGIAYFVRYNLMMTSALTLALMLFSSIGVLQAVSRKSTIKCACLGTVFNLPMTYITLFEDMLMVLMAGMALSFSEVRFPLP